MIMRSNDLHTPKPKHKMGKRCELLSMQEQSVYALLACIKSAPSLRRFKSAGLKV